MAVCAATCNDPRGEPGCPDDREAGRRQRRSLACHDVEVALPFHDLDFRRGNIGFRVLRAAPNPAVHAQVDPGVADAQRANG